VKLAIAGRSCTGKSSLSELISTRMGAVVRHCGEELKRESCAAGAGLPAPLNVHVGVDRATQEWVCNTAAPLIVEGRYLAYVLSAVTGVILVELECELEERVRRARLHRRAREGYVQRSDAEDVATIQLLYQDVMPRGADFVIDTSVLTLEAVAERVRELLESRA